MKLGWIFPVLLLCGLIAVPDRTAAVASDAAMLWWTRVLPTLLPYLITASLLERSGLLHHAPKRIAPLLLWLFGAIGGYPVGAKLAARLSRDGVLTETDARRAAALCNLPNPVFIISVVALSVFQNGRAAFPLLIGVYGVSLIGLFPLYRMRFQSMPIGSDRFSPNDLPPAIEQGVHSVLQIGGCMIFASVLGALIRATGAERLCSAAFGIKEDTVHAWLLGFIEMTGGVGAAASLSLPLRVRLAICAGFIRFGGCSVLLQTASQIKVSLPRAAGIILAEAVCSAIVTLCLTPLFCPDTAIPTFASRAELLQNGSVLLSVVVSASIGLLAVFTLTFGLTYRKKAP